VRRVRVRIDGHVQGVFFRATCRRLANELGVAGWVRNTADGAVEALFEGDDAAVHRILGWCRDGPPGAAVASIDVRDEPPKGRRPPFEVR
jgi:acylphosphatase